MPDASYKIGKYKNRHTKIGTATIYVNFFFGPPLADVASHKWSLSLFNLFPCDILYTRYDIRVLVGYCYAGREESLPMGQVVSSGSFAISAYICYR